MVTLWSQHVMLVEFEWALSYIVWLRPLDTAKTPNTPGVVPTPSLRPMTLITEVYPERMQILEEGWHFHSTPKGRYWRDRQPPGGSLKNLPLPPQQMPTVRTPPTRSCSGTLTRRYTTMTPQSTTMLHSQKQTSAHTRVILELLMMFENILSPSTESVCFCTTFIPQHRDICPCLREVECTGESGTNRPVEQQINAEVEGRTLIWVCRSIPCILGDYRRALWTF